MDWYGFTQDFSYDVLSLEGVVYLCVWGNFGKKASSCNKWQSVVTLIFKWANKRELYSIFNAFILCPLSFYKVTLTTSYFSPKRVILTKKKKFDNKYTQEIKK